MSKLSCQLSHKISDSRSQNRNQNLIFDRILFFLLFLHNLYMFVNKKNPHKYDINLWEIKRITGDQIPDSAFNSAVNYLFFSPEHIKSQMNE